MLWSLGWCRDPTLVFSLRSRVCREGRESSTEPRELLVTVRESREEGQTPREASQGVVREGRREEERERWVIAQPLVQGMGGRGEVRQEQERWEGEGQEHEEGQEEPSTGSSSSKGSRAIILASALANGL